MTKTAAVEARTDAWAPTRKHIVACVDDEPAVLSAFRRVLRREPYELRTTLDPKEALSWVERDDVSLVIVDQRMPEMNGSDLVHAIAHRSPATLRVMLTGYPDTSVFFERMDQDIHRLLTKPWDDWELRRLIRDLLTGKERGRPIKAASPAVLGAMLAPPPPPERAPWEIIVSLDCSGLSAEQAIAKIAPRLKNARDAGARLLLYVNNVKMLSDSVARFMDTLLGRVLTCGAQVTVVDPTGCLGTWCDAAAAPAGSIRVTREPAGPTHERA